MIKVREVFKINGEATVLVCDLFSDSEIGSVIQSNIGQHVNFEVFPIKACFSQPKTRNILVFGNEDYSKIATIEFV